MALLQILLAIFTRTAGRLLNAVFAWATIALFGRVPPRQQLYLSVMAFGSIAWLISAIGIAFPSVATLLLAFVTVPSWVRPGWIRLVMLLTSLTCPLLVGGFCLLALDPAERPGTPAARIKAVLRGYPVTVGLSLTLATLLVFVPILRVRAAMKRWTSAHVPVLVKPDAYVDVLRDLERALAADGWRTARLPASWTLRIPLRVLVALAGRSVPFVAEHLTTLRADRLEVTLHPSDLILSGPAGDVMRVRARLAERLAFSRLYMTWTSEAQCLEDGLRKLWLSFEVRNGGEGDQEGRERAIEHDLRAAELSYEEWEVLFRKLLLLERHLAGLDGHAPERRYRPASQTT